MPKATEVKITDGMSSGADAFFAEWFVGRRIVAVHEVEDSDRGEVLLLLDDGRSCLISCDPVRHDDEGLWLPEEKWGERWDVVLYNTTETEAGRAAKAAQP
jgi:hypothetical protein